MNYYEQQIQSLTRRIKKIEESPDPILLRSNKLFYELEKEQRQHELDAWQQGKPFAAVRRGSGLVSAMGFEAQHFSISMDRSRRYSEYKPLIERMGFPEQCCDRALGALAAIEVADFAKPRIILNQSHTCDSNMLVYSAIARRYNIPEFKIDVNLNAENEPNLDYLNYIADQLGEFIEWAESKVPGVKYDKDKHIEIQEMDDIARRYFRDIYELRKRVPCPITPLDAFRIPREPSLYSNMQNAIEYLRIWRDELGERVASGKGPYPEERLRILWANTGPFSHNFNPFRVLMERKVAMPVLLEGSAVRDFGVKGDVNYGVKLSLLQEEASWIDMCTHAGPGKRYVTDTLDLARDIGAHGIVNFLQIGCVPVVGISSVLAARAEKELGIPVLNVVGRTLDPDYTTQERFEEVLSAFIDKCFDRAGKPRQ